MGGDKKNRREWCGRNAMSHGRVYFTCGVKEAKPLAFPFCLKKMSRQAPLYRSGIVTRMGRNRLLGSVEQSKI